MSTQETDCRNRPVKTSDSRDIRMFVQLVFKTMEFTFKYIKERLENNIRDRKL